MNSKLVEAAGEGDLETVQKLLKTGVDINAPNTVGMTALIFATIRRQLKVVEVLIAEGADLNVKAGGYTALMCAAKSGYLDILVRLIEVGADLNEEDNSGKSAVKWAKKMKHPEIVNALKQALAKKSGSKITLHEGVLARVRKGFSQIIGNVRE